jgi:hypothetical protein
MTTPHQQPTPAAPVREANAARPLMLAAFSERAYERAKRRYARILEEDTALALNEAEYLAMDLQALMSAMTASNVPPADCALVFPFYRAANDLLEALGELRADEHTRAEALAVRNRAVIATNIAREEASARSRTGDPTDG